jgi:parvulin-like peptidyl-prolyl isomerase
MKRGVAVWLAIGIGVAGGIVSAQLAARSIVLRDKLGTSCGRGHLLALAHGRGIYQGDVDRTLTESYYLAGADHREQTNVEQQSALADLIANAGIQSHADQERSPRREDIKRELNLLRWQFRDDQTWKQALGQSSLFTPLFWKTLGNHLCSRHWIEKRIDPEIAVTDDDCRRFYESHLDNFFVPQRLRVSHIFLAAPPETTPEMVEAKRTAIGALSVRLTGSEDFSALAASNSEDDATKLRGGDLGYFSATRMPPDFVEAAVKLHPGEISRPIRTRLGFHIIQLIDAQPPRQETFDEARGDIAIELANYKREAAVRRLIVDLSSEATYLRPL